MAMLYVLLKDARSQQRSNFGGFGKGQAAFEVKPRYLTVLSIFQVKFGFRGDYLSLETIDAFVRRKSRIEQGLLGPVTSLAHSQLRPGERPQVQPFKLAGSVIGDSGIMPLPVGFCTRPAALLHPGPFVQTAAFMPSSLRLSLGGHDDRSAAW